VFTSIGLITTTCVGSTSLKFISLTLKSFIGRPFVKRFVLCYRTVVLSVCLTVCLSCPVLSVTLVYCGQTVRRVKMKLGMQVGLVPGHIVLDGNPAPSPLKEHSPQFSAHICCGQMAECIKMSLGMEVGLGQGDFVLDWYPAPLPKKGAERPPPKKKLRPMFSVAKRLDGSRWYLAWR